jgi:hypothetical protein
MYMLCGLRRTLQVNALSIFAVTFANTCVGQHLYFYLNHPIRYVCVVGVVVAIDDINIWYTVLTIDDGSGANIEVKIVRISSPKKSAIYSSPETQIENVRIISQLGVFEVMVGNQALDIGSVIKAKGTISEFRGVKQLEMKRVWVINTTNEEARAWAEVATFKRDVLSKPWHLSTAEARKIKHDKKVEIKKEQKYAEYERGKAQRVQARNAYIAEREGRLEARRRKEEIMMNAGAII